MVHPLLLKPNSSSRFFDLNAFCLKKMFNNLCDKCRPIYVFKNTILWSCWHRGLKNVSNFYIICSLPRHNKPGHRPHYCWWTTYQFVIVSQIFIKIFDFLCPAYFSIKNMSFCRFFFESASIALVSARGLFYDHLVLFVILAWLPTSTFF